MQNNASNPTTMYSSLNYTNLAFPGPAAYPFYSASQSNTCNVYIPNDSTLSRSVCLLSNFLLILSSNSDAYRP